MLVPKPFNNVGKLGVLIEDKRLEKANNKNGISIPVLNFLISCLLFINLIPKIIKKMTVIKIINDWFRKKLKPKPKK